MKTKIVLALFTCVLLSSCIKHYYGHPDDKDLILTKKNYIYSDDIKTVFLEMEVAELDAEIDELNVKIHEGKANDAEKERFKVAQEKRTDNLVQLKEISVYRDIVYRRGPIPPPPCPLPNNCNDWLNFRYVTVPPGLENFQMLIYNEKQEIIAQTEGIPEPLERVDEVLDYVVLIFNTTDYKGKIFVEVQTEVKKGQFDKFFINSEIK